MELSFKEKQKVDGLHYCELLSGKNGGYGSAVNYCFETDGKENYDSLDKKVSGELYVSNSEYESQVNFCPVCGFESKVKINA